MLQVAGCSLSLAACSPVIVSGRLRLYHRRQVAQRFKRDVAEDPVFAGLPPGWRLDLADRPAVGQQRAARAARMEAAAAGRIQWARHAALQADVLLFDAWVGDRYGCEQ